MRKAVMYSAVTQQKKPQCQGLGAAIFKLAMHSSFGAQGTSFWPAGRQETAADMRGRRYVHPLKVLLSSHAHIQSVPPLVLHRGCKATRNKRF